MKKILLIPAAAILLIGGILLFSDISSAKERKKAMEQVIRLHVRAEDDSEEEQALKLKVRDEILICTENLLTGCEDKAEAKEIIETHLSDLQKAGQRAVVREGKNHTVTVSLGRETFQHREYDGFFLPEGEYDSLIVSIGSGNGKNWWCVVFPAACYMGAAEVETDETKMPECFRIAKTRAEDITVKFWFWEKIKKLFS